MNIQTVNSILNLLNSRFEGLENYVEIKFPKVSELNFDYLDTRPTEGIGLCAALAEALIEAGVFEVRVYSASTGDKWNPLVERFDTWARGQNKIHAYQSQQSEPDLFEVKRWLDPFFK